MRNRKKICIAVATLVLGMCSNSFALDLSKFQPFNRRQSQPALEQQLYNNDNNNQIQLPERLVSLSADSNYQERHDGMVTLGARPRRDGERYLLPPETRIPKELRPVLTERRTPRQGMSMHGGTGATLVPSPGILEPGKTAVGLHVMAFDLRNINDVKYTDTNYFDTKISIAHGIESGAEVSIDGTFDNQDRFDLPQPVYINAKYQVPGNVTVGGSFAISGAGYHSLWVGAGVPVAWVAAGLNFGEDDYRFTYSGWDKLKRAKYGGYNYDYSKATGYADTVFFLIGGAVPLNDNLRFVYDFNGDKFSLGFRFNYIDSFYLNASFVSEGDYENLPGPIAHKRAKTFVFGGTLVY